MASAEPASSSIWYARSIELPDGLTARIAAYTSQDFPDGTVVGDDVLQGFDLQSRPQLWSAHYEVAAGRLFRVEVTASAAAPAPNMWYVEVPEPDATPPAVTLIAYDTGDFAAGVIVDNRSFVPLPVSSDDQLGAIRWWPSSGRLDQVYVHPRWRRRGIGTTLIYAASAHLQASGTGTRIWTGGERTDLGEELAKAMHHPQRVAVRSAAVPPMTPPDQMAGIAPRNLYPSP